MKPKHLNSLIVKERGIYMSYPARQIDSTKPYKLRIYFKSGIHKGDLKRQEYFSNLNDLDRRYKELGPNKFADYALNPTA